MRAIGQRFRLVTERDRVDDCFLGGEDGALQSERRKTRSRMASSKVDPRIIAITCPASQKPVLP